MGKRIRPEQLAQVIAEELDEYADMTADIMKASVKRAGTTARSEIRAGAPKKSERYARSWRTKTTKETSNKMEVTVYSPSRYMLAHLLEHGHVKRGGGRTRSFEHIAPAEQKAEKQLLSDIERGLRHG